MVAAHATRTSNAMGRVIVRGRGFRRWIDTDIQSVYR
jgi:hypothetical protein